MSASIIKDSFKASLAGQFISLSQSQLTNTEIDNFIEYLIQHNIIPPATMKIYSVLAEFEKIAQIHPEKNKSQLVELLTAKFNLDKNTVSNLLKDHKSKYHFA